MVFIYIFTLWLTNNIIIVIYLKPLYIIRFLGLRCMYFMYPLKTFMLYIPYWLTSILYFLYLPKTVSLFIRYAHKKLRVGGPFFLSFLWYIHGIYKNIRYLYI